MVLLVKSGFRNLSEEDKMKKLMWLLVLSMFLSSCGNAERYEFIGSSENWEVLYIVKVTGRNMEETSAIIKYKGEGKAPKAINYALDGKSGGSSGTDIPITNGMVETAKSSCSGCVTIIQKDEEIDMKIMWNGQKDQFILTAE